MKDLLLIFWLFFKLGIVNFGGGYALLPLLQREFCEKRDWLTDDEIADYYAIGQCTPGAIAVNVSTFVGYRRKGVIGGIIATLGFVFPALIIISVIASILTNFADVEQVQSAFKAIRVVVFVLVLQAIIKLSKKSVTDIFQLIICLLVLFLSIFTNIPLFVYVIVAGVAGIVIGLSKERYKKVKKISKDNDETKEEIVEEKIDEATETVVIKIDKSVKVEKDNIKVVKEESILKTLLYFFLGFITGISLGVLGIPLIFVVKNKKFKDGFLTTVLLWILLLVLILVSAFSGNWIFINLFFEFFRVGICAFGGGLATIPFLKELSQTTGWFTIDELANMIAVSESTPGAMGINMSTYVGYKVISTEFSNIGLGYIGGVISTLGLVTPSILVIIVVCQILMIFRHAKGVEWAFYGLRAASIGLIGNAAYSILTLSIVSPTNAANAYNSHSINGFGDFMGAISDSIINFFDYKCLALALFMGILIFKFKKHPIIYIAAAAVIGIVFQF